MAVLMKKNAISRQIGAAFGRVSPPSSSITNPSVENPPLRHNDKVEIEAHTPRPSALITNEGGENCLYRFIGGAAYFSCAYSDC